MSFKSDSLLHSAVRTWFLFLPIPRSQAASRQQDLSLFRGLSSPENFYDTPSSPRNDYFTLTWGVAALGVACSPERGAPACLPHLILNAVSFVLSPGIP